MRPGNMGLVCGKEYPAGIHHATTCRWKWKNSVILLAVYPVPLISVYDPTLSSTGEAKDKFYGELVTTIKGIPENWESFRTGLFIIG